MAFSSATVELCLQVRRSCIAKLVTRICAPSLCHTANADNVSLIATLAINVHVNSSLKQETRCVVSIKEYPKVLSLFFEDVLQPTCT